MRRFAAVGIVMIGLWSLGATITLIGSTFAMAQTGSGGSLDRITLAVNLISLLVSAAIGVALIMGRKWLAARWFDDAEIAVSVESLELLRIALVLTGLFLMSQGVESAFFSAANGAIQVRALASVAGEMGRLELWASSLSSVAFGLLRLFVGWLVVYFSARLAVFFWGLSPKPRVPVIALVQAPPATCPACGAGYDPADYREGVERRCVECHASLDGDDA